MFEPGKTRPCPAVIFSVTVQKLAVIWDFSSRFGEKRRFFWGKSLFSFRWCFCGGDFPNGRTESTECRAVSGAECHGDAKFRASGRFCGIPRRVEWSGRQNGSRVPFCASFRHSGGQSVVTRAVWKQRAERSAKPHGAGCRTCRTVVVGLRQCWNVNIVARARICARTLISPNPVRCF